MGCDVIENGGNIPCKGSHDLRISCLHKCVRMILWLLLCIILFSRYQVS